MGDVLQLDERRRRAPAPPADDLPPAHDLDTEAALLAAALLVPTGTSAEADAQRARLERAHERLAERGAAVFYDFANGRIWEAITALRTSGTPIGVDTVAAWLRDRGLLEKAGGLERLGDLITRAQEPGTVEAHADRLVKLWECRDIAATCLRVQAEARMPRDDHEAWKLEARRELGRATAPRMALRGRHVGAVADEVHAHVKEVSSGQVVGVSWGLRPLDEGLGLLVRGRHHILAGESEHGKTSLAWQVGEAVSMTPPDALGVGEAVYWLTGEMPARDLLLRGACSAAGVDVQALEAGGAHPDALRRVERYLGWIRSLPIIIDDDPAPADEIARRVRAHQQVFAAGKARDGHGELLPKCRMQLVIGDHLQRLADVAHGLGGNADLRSRIASVSKGWAIEIAQRSKVATLLLSQLKSADEREQRRDPKREKDAVPWPKIGDLWGGNAIRADADRVIAVCRPDMYLRGKAAAAWAGVGVVVPLKGRFGGTKRKIRLGFDRGRFTEDLPPAAVLNGDDDE